MCRITRAPWRAWHDGYLRQLMVLQLKQQQIQHCNLLAAIKSSLKDRNSTLNASTPRGKKASRAREVIELSGTPAKFSEHEGPWGRNKTSKENAFRKRIYSTLGGHASDNKKYYLSRPEFLVRVKSMDDAKDMHDWNEKVVYMDNFQDL